MNRRDRGLTLIEILLALIVMVLGIVGILALFPPAMESAKISMEETQGAILGESVANAITNAARFAALQSSGHYQLTINHDSINSQSGALVYYQFLLPRFTDGWGPGPTPYSGTNWYHHPATPTPGIGSVYTGSAELQPDWRLTGDPWTKAQFDIIKGTTPTSGFDGSEPLNQFAYSFDVRKINTLEYLMLPPPVGQSLTAEQVDPLVRVWELRIHTFRAQVQGSFSSGTGSSTTGATSKKWIATLTTRITVR